jgi:hypothetical protein
MQSDRPANSQGIDITKNNCANKDAWNEILKVCRHICDCNANPDSSTSRFWDGAGDVASDAAKETILKGPKASTLPKALAFNVLKWTIKGTMIPKGSMEHDRKEGGSYDPDTPNYSEDIIAPGSTQVKKRQLQKCMHTKLMEDYKDLVDKSGPFASFANNILSEHPYSMSQGAEPLISPKLHQMDTAGVPWSRWNAAARLKKAGVPQVEIDDYITGKETFDSLRKRGVISNEISDYENGDRRSWDAVIVKDPSKPATGSNIEYLLKVNASGEDWTQEEWRAAMETVGEDNAGKIQTLSPKSCKCDDGKQKLGSPIWDFISTDRPRRERI